jgi:carnosine N-methyltransferase
MILAFRLLLSPATTQEVGQHKIRPYAHWFSHQRSTENLFRSVSFPDAVPRLGPNFRLLEDDFLKIPTSPSEFWSSDQTQTPTHSPQGYDYIVTLFFIDTSFNVFATMEKIYKLLKPGGSWVNLGPLLWSGGGQCKVELSLEELLVAAEEIGFVISRPSTEEHNDHPEQQKTVECEYTADPNAMMRWTYKTEFWVAKKPQ